MNLYPYQERGALFLQQHTRAYLADEMGLGKTVQAIVAARAVEPELTLVVCPASVVENWRREWETWQGPGSLEVVSYSKLIRQTITADMLFDLVILDEAHYCKTPSAKRTMAALAVAKRAPRAWLLSGTPIPNDIRELYPVFRHLFPEKFPTLTSAFKWMDHFTIWSDSDYGYRVWANKATVKSEMLPALRSIMFRRRLEDIALELPPLRITTQYLDKDSTLAEELEALGAQPDDEEHMSTLRRILGEYKAPRVAQILLEEINEGRDMVILYHHRATGEALAVALGNNDHGPLWGFDGSTPSPQRQKEIDGFQREGGVFLAQQGAAGTGITLTRASEIVLVEPSWSPSDNEQAIKRIHRIGQEQPCRARIFAVPDSLDEALMATLVRKTAMVEEVLDE